MVVSTLINKETYDCFPPKTAILTVWLFAWVPPQPRWHTPSPRPCALCCPPWAGAHQHAWNRGWGHPAAPFGQPCCAPQKALSAHGNRAAPGPAVPGGRAAQGTGHAPGGTSPPQLLLQRDPETRPRSPAAMTSSKIWVLISDVLV